MSLRRCFLVGPCRSRIDRLHPILSSASQYQWTAPGTQTTNLDWNQSRRQHESANSKILIYQGKLGNRILYLKGISILSSFGLACSYGYVVGQKGLSVAIAGIGLAFIPFFLSPVAISWFFKRYVTELYYDPINDKFTAHHYGLFLNKKECTYKSEDVVRSDVTHMLNTFTVGKRPFFLNDEDLSSDEAVKLYRKMLGTENKAYT